MSLHVAKLLGFRASAPQPQRCQILVGDNRETLRTIPDKSVQCVVTSPPYFGLRDYGVDGQMGLEATPDAFCTELVSLFREIRRALKDDGTAWLNLGDTYASQRGGTTPPAQTVAGGVNGKGGTRERRGQAEGYNPSRDCLRYGLKHKDLIGIPWRVAFALQADGWYLRQDIIWHKPNPMPESVRDRCTKAHEYIFLLSKSEKYFFDSDAMQEPAVGGARGSEFHTGKTGEHQSGRASKKPRTSGNKTHKYVEAYEVSPTEEHRTKAGLLNVADKPWETRNRRSVWTVATKPYKGAHFATFPPDLVEPCVLAGSRPGDIVLDPFGGSGTTAQVALKHGRRAVLCELNPDYVPLIHERISGV